MPVYCIYLEASVTVLFYRLIAIRCSRNSFLLRNPNAHIPVHTSQPLDTTLILRNPIHTFKTYLSKTNFNTILPSNPQACFKVITSLEIIRHFVYNFPMRAICPVQHIFLQFNHNIKRNYEVTTILIIFIFLLLPRFWTKIYFLKYSIVSPTSQLRTIEKLVLVRT